MEPLDKGSSVQGQGTGRFILAVFQRVSMFVEVREQLCGVCWVPETQAPCLYCKNLCLWSLFGCPKRED